MHLTGAAAAGMKHDDNGGVGAETLRDVDEDAKVGGIGTEIAELLKYTGRNLRGSGLTRSRRRVRRSRTWYGTSWNALVIPLIHDVTRRTRHAGGLTTPTSPTALTPYRNRS